MNSFTPAFSTHGVSTKMNWWMIWIQKISVPEGSEELETLDEIHGCSQHKNTQIYIYIRIYIYYIYIYFFLHHKGLNKNIHFKEFENVPPLERDWTENVMFCSWLEFWGASCIPNEHESSTKFHVEWKWVCTMTCFFETIKPTKKQGNVNWLVPSQGTPSRSVKRGFFPEKQWMSANLILNDVELL